MGLRLVIFFMSSLVLSSGYAQVRPDQFPEETNPTDQNFEVYSQKNGQVRKASLGNLKKFFAPGVETTPVTYVPQTTGNTSNRMSYVTDPSGDVWYIDAVGHAVKLRGEGKVYARQTVPVFSGTQFTIPADAQDVRVYLGGLLQEENADYTRNGSFINFSWTPPGLRLTIIYKQ